LRQPHLRISWFMGTRVRLRRNYLMILNFVTAAWVTKLFIHPARPGSVSEFYRRLAVGDLIPPWFVAITAVGFVLGGLAIAATCPPAEKLEKWGGAFLEPSGRGQETREP